MKAHLHNGRAVEMAEAEAMRSESYSNAIEVDQPWHSHGPVLQIGGMAYFQGNAHDPDDRCGTDALSMKVKSITLDGYCESDLMASYILIPDVDGR